MWQHFRNRPRTLVHFDGQIERRGSAFMRFVMGEQVVLSRGLCHFERMNAPENLRSFQALQSVRLRSKTRTPIDNPDFRYQLNDTTLGVWSWSNQTLDALGEFEGEVIPETLLHPPAHNAVRLVDCIEGYEGQIWQDGRLTHSRWWQNQPDASGWMMFLRAARVDHVEPERLTAPDLTHLASGKTFIERVLNLKMPRWQDIAAFATIGCLAPSLWISSQWLALSTERDRLQNSIDELSEQTQSLAQAQQNAQRARAELNAYGESLIYVHPAEILTAMTRITDGFDLRIASFELREFRLSVVVEAAENFAPADLVATLEQRP